jgi:DNA-binding transcriptional MerR regulator
MEEPRWTLDELAERVDAALAVDYHGQSSGRVRDVPDRRAIRWYTTIGLIDRPLAHRGRTALYGPRHLLQLVAVKRLQAKGLPLVAIQQELAGATDTDLERVARVPAAAATGREAASPEAGPALSATTGPAGREAASPEAASLHAGPVPSATTGPARPAPAPRRLAAGPARRAAFWREPPGAALTAGAAGAAGAGGAAAEAAGAAEAGAAADALAAATATDAAARILAADATLPRPAADATLTRPTAGVATLRGIRLGDGATLLLEPGRDLDADDLRAVHDAARPLIAVLRARRLGGTPAPGRAAGGEPRREHL